MSGSTILMLQTGRLLFEPEAAGMNSLRTRHGDGKLCQLLLEDARLCQLLLEGDVFFLDVGAFVDAINGCGQHLVIPMTDGTSDWRAAVLQRVRAAHPSLMPFVVCLRCTLNGKEVGAVCKPDDLADATLRWRLPGLLGGAPKAQDVDTRKDVDTMNKEDLMRYAKNILGVEVRQAGPDGKKNRWRSVNDVKKDCKEVQATLLQSLQDNDPVENPAEASASSWERLPPASARAPSEGESVDNRQATRRIAGSLGIKQMGKTKRQLDANILDANTGQQTLDSAWEKKNYCNRAKRRTTIASSDWQW
jgi:hypothetical protein